jgi:hypothetical protein
MWTYHQGSGLWVGHGLQWQGYAGHGEGKNNPARQAERGVGPIPCGLWSIIGPPQELPSRHYFLRLEPLPGTEAFGRDGFLLHGDSLEHPGDASEGCIVQGPTCRKTVWESGDHVVEVVP